MQIRIDVGFQSVWGSLSDDYLQMRANLKALPEKADIVATTKLGLASSSSSRVSRRPERRCRGQSSTIPSLEFIVQQRYDFDCPHDFDCPLKQAQQGLPRRDAIFPATLIPGDLTKEPKASSAPP
eukprot:1913772-Pleurochrysis_carterae.AAC.3